MKNQFILFLLILPSLLFCQQTEEIFKKVEEMPRFPGCEQLTGDHEAKRQCSNQKLIEYIYTNLKYPAEARKNEVEGIVVIQFVVGKDGSIRDAKIARDIGHGCGEAALKVVKNMANLVQRDTIITFNEQTYEETVKVVSNDLSWTPGYQRGKAVNVLYTLPVKYKLEGDKKPIQENIRRDTIITFNEKTYEETVKIVTYNEEPTLDDEWLRPPPENYTFDQYKTEVLIPKLVAKTYVVEPIEKSKIVGEIIPYGQAMHPILKKMGSHNGIDFRAVPGVAVMATADGVIELTDTNHEKYGQYVKIKHAERAISLYAHMSDILVTNGQKVKAGQQIGAVGMSGKATYPHLHYEVIISNQTENPIQKAHHNTTKISLHNNVITDKTPLIVIDGVIQDLDYNVEHLDKNAIESLSVLKGEKAINKYGDMASNGVIEIVLKSNEIQDLKEDILTGLNVKFELQQNFPNPVNDFTTIAFELPNDRPASLHFYNQSGEFVHKITNGLTKGYNEIKVSANDLNASGLIYYFLIQDHMTAVKKMIITK